MLIKPSQEQRKVLQALSSSENGRVLKEYVQALVDGVADVRNDSTLTLEERKNLAIFIEENLLNRLEGKETKYTPSSWE